MPNSAYIHSKTWIIVILFSFFAILILISKSSGEDETIADEWIIEKYYINYKNMTSVYANGTIEIYEAIIFGENKNADEIRELYKNESLRKFMLENLTNKCEKTFNDMIRDIFPNSTSNFNRTRIYINEDSLSNDSSIDEYYTPIIIIADADIFLTKKSYKMEKIKKLEDVILGVLKMGGIITKEVNLSAEPGHKRIYNFYLPKDIKVINEGKIVEKIVDNLNGTTYKKDIYSFSFASESPNPSFEENIFVRISIDFFDFGEVYIKISISINSIGIKEYEFPKSITNLSYVSNDGIRLGISTNLTSLEEIYNRTIKELKENIEEKFSKIFGNVILNFSWNNSSLIGYNLNVMKGEDVICYLNGTIITNKIYKKDKQLIRGLVNSGAKIKMNLTLNEKYKYKNELILPENYKLITNDTVMNGKRDIVYFGSKLEGMLIYKNATHYSEEKKNINAVLDMHTINLIFIGVKINADIIGGVEIYWVEIPSYFKEELPEEVIMEYVNADAIRIALDYKLISKEDIDNDTKKLYEKIEDKLSNSFGENITIDIELLSESLIGYDIKKMDAEIPIKIKIIGKIIYSIDILSKNALIEFAFNFPFEAIENSTTTYKVIFPRGISILSINDNLKKVKKGSENSREFIELTLNKGEKDEVKLKLDITLWFILEKFFPCLMLIAVLIITFVYIKIRKRRKKI